MRKILLLVTFLISAQTVLCQEDSLYTKQIVVANELFAAKEYAKASIAYQNAFDSNGGKVWDFYNAACAWAQNNEVEKAVSHLLWLTQNRKFDGYGSLVVNLYLFPLEHHEKWDSILLLASKNRFLNNPNLDKELTLILDSVQIRDQKLRQQSEILEAQFGVKSKEVTALWKEVLINDSINQIEVEKILSNEGWPSIERIGDDGSSAIFMVVQHAPLNKQIRWFPLVKKAFEAGIVPSYLFAMLEDRIAIMQGKLQIYGSQIGMDNAMNNAMYLMPVVDPDNLDKRRAAVGLPPFADY